MEDDGGGMNVLPPVFGNAGSGDGAVDLNEVFAGEGRKGARVTPRKDRECGPLTIQTLVGPDCFLMSEFNLPTGDTTSSFPSV